MIRGSIIALAAMAGIVTPLHAAQTVAFVGGPTTLAWQQSAPFTHAMGGGVGYGFQSQLSIGGDCVETNQALVVVKKLLAAGPNKPSIIHLMVGQYDSAVPVDSNPEAWALQDFQGCFDTLVKTIQAAKEPLIVGLAPFGLIADIRPFNDFMYAYCLQNNVPVIDYYTMLSIDGNQDVSTSPNLIYPPGFPNTPVTMTTTGWSLMTNLANAAIAQAFNGIKLKSGYLNNVAALPGNSEYNPVPNVNTVVPDTVMQWLAEGQYSNGQTMEINNANINGLFGTWTSSNPSVMKITPTGESFAIGLGTTNIKFTTLAGQTISEWTMYVQRDCTPGGCFGGWTPK